MRRHVASFALLAMATGQPAHAAGFAGVAPVPVDELGAMRGGFVLPGGVIVNLGVTTDTRVDGREVLRTAFDIRSGISSVTVSAGRDGEQAQVQLTPDGAGVSTDGGVVSLRSAANGSRVELAGDRIAIAHLLGGALGSVVANAGNDRDVQVATTVDIGLSGISPDALGSSAAQVENLALASTALLNR